MRRSRIGAAVLALVVAGCGSNVSPSSQGVEAGDGTVVTDDGVVVADGAGTDTGSGTVPPSGGLPDAGGPGGGAAAPGPAGQPAPGSDPGAPPPTGENAPTGGEKAASCDGFRNTTGITDDKIVIGNASDVSGPVPGLFESAQRAVQAYVAYFNASGSTICGRKLELASYDTRTDAAADQQAYTKGCTDTFAMVGSMSGFDSGGAATAEDCGLPDIRAISVTAQRTACTTCYAAQPAGPQAFQNVVPDFLMRNFDGGQKAGMVYLNGGAAAENGPSQVRFSTRRGMKFVYTSGIDLAEFNYVPYVQAMKDKGVETVQFVGANPQFVKLAQTMAQQGFEPKAYLLDPTAYSKEYTDAAGSAADGTIVFLNFVPFEEARANPEVALYLSWLAQVSPSAEPDFFGLFAWSAARLFVERATALGGGLTRQSLIASVGKVDDWTSNGLHAPMHVGSKKIGDCWRFIQWTGTSWKALEGTKFQCRGLTS